MFQSIQKKSTQKNSLRNTSLSLLLCCTALVAGQAFGQEYVEGQHYSRLTTPVRVADPNKIELAEVFSYACPHCYTFEGVIGAYKQSLPDDVNFVTTHIVWDGATRNLAQAMYTAQALQVEDAMHTALFRAIHQERKRVATPEQIKAVFVDQGVDPEDFDKAFDSFAVKSQVRQADARVRGYKISSTPQLVVNGEYVIAATRNIDHQEMVKIADYLINKIREES